MKMEQACRFRTDEAGYMVCARSQGLTADNENNLGYFNSTMTSLFEKDGSGPRMGQSILSYAVSEENGGRRLEEDPFVAELFRYLASAAPEERRQMLLDMQYILGGAGAAGVCVTGDDRHRISHAEDERWKPAGK